MKPLLLVALLASLCSSAAPAPEREPPVEVRRVAVPSQPEARVIAARTRRVLAVETSVGPVALWAAPTRGGGECWVLDVQALPPENGAACSAAPGRSDFVIRPWLSDTNVGDATLRLLNARVTPNVALVEIRFADGRTDEVRPTGGFFVRELRDDEEPQLVVARDAAGSVLRRRSMPGPRSFRRELPFPTGSYRKVIELKTSAGRPMTFAVSPGTNGSVCQRTLYRRAQTWSCGQGLGGLAPDEIAVDRTLSAAICVLAGSVGSAISRLEVWYEGGAAERVPITEQYVLFEIPRGRVPRVLAGFDAGGSLVARRRLSY